MALKMDLCMLSSWYYKCCCIIFVSSVVFGQLSWLCMKRLQQEFEPPVSKQKSKSFEIIYTRRMEKQRSAIGSQFAT